MHDEEENYRDEGSGRHYHLPLPKTTAFLTALRPSKSGSRTGTYLVNVASGFKPSQSTLEEGPFLSSDGRKRYGDLLSIVLLGALAACMTEYSPLAYDKIKDETAPASEEIQLMLVSLVYAPGLFVC